MLGKITGVDKGWNIFPTAQRFPICMKSMDSYINIGTICFTIHHRAISNADV